jgi:hypothetical protein
MATLSRAASIAVAPGFEKVLVIISGVAVLVECLENERALQRVSDCSGGS